MKKLLSIALCATAAMSFAATEVEVASVGVTEITIPSGQQNTIIASSFSGLNGTDGGVTVEHLIKTATGLADGDQLMLFRSGKYYTFNWSTADGWKANTAVETGSSEATTFSDDTELTVGEGLWLIRNSTDGEVKLYLYGATPSSTTVTTTAGAWNLIGNPTESSYTITAGVKGDKIVTVVEGALREYNYVASKGWYYQTFADGVRTVHDEDPTIAPGVGFWYYTQSEQTITWGK